MSNSEEIKCPNLTFGIGELTDEQAERACDGPMGEKIKELQKKWKRGIGDIGEIVNKLKEVDHLQATLQEKANNFEERMYLIGMMCCLNSYKSNYDIKDFDYFANEYKESKKEIFSDEVALLIKKTRELILLKIEAEKNYE